MRNIFYLCTMGFILSACGNLFPAPEEPTKKYTLAALLSEPGRPDMPVAHRRPHHLVIDLPTLYTPVDTTRIALKPQEQTIDYYADVEWADRLSTLIQESLIYSLQNKEVLRGVSRPTEGIQTDYALKMEVRKFYIEQNSMPAIPTVQIDYMAYLIKLPQRHIVASRRFTYAKAIPEKTMDSIIRSFNLAHLEVSKSLIPWILQHVH
jgi:ABC-type uncharacterized transport system auxiliary subunit